MFRERGGILDVHLMVDNPEHHFEQFAKVGADSVTFHHEVVDDPSPLVDHARRLGMGVGLAFNPETTPEDVAAAAEGMDVVLCMGIHPGYSGQAYLPETTSRVQRLRELLPDETFIQVDGGVGLQNVGELRAAGASLFVAGSSVFGRDDPGRRIPHARRSGPVSHLQRALELAERGRGTTHPNPVVGAVVVRDGEWSGRAGTSGRAGRMPRSSRSTRQASGRAARRST